MNRMSVTEFLCFNGGELYTSELFCNSNSRVPTNLEISVKFMEKISKINCFRYEIIFEIIVQNLNTFVIVIIANVKLDLMITF